MPNICNKIIARKYNLNINQQNGGLTKFQDKINLADERNIKNTVPAGHSVRKGG